MQFLLYFFKVSGKFGHGEALTSELFQSDRNLITATENFVLDRPSSSNNMSSNIVILFLRVMSLQLDLYLGLGIDGKLTQSNRSN